MNIEKDQNTIPVKVQLTNGHIRYGILLDEPEQMKRKLKNAWRFISSSNIATYLQTRSQRLIELLPDSSIICFDVHLK